MIPKFRVWLPDPEVERMLRVKALVFEHNKTRCVCGYAYDFYLEDEDAIIMQSTGLYDKNGKEIFEGDIITNGEAVVDVKNHPTLGFYTTPNGVERFFGDNTSIRDFNNDVEDFYNVTEIIGNVYENPELLEAE